MTVRLSPPYCWCDSRCDRCPLATDCAITALEDDFDPVPDVRVFELRKTDTQLRLERHAAVYALAVEALWSRADRLAGGRSAADLVGPVTARVARHLLPDDRLDPEAAADTGPTLLLLERCLAAAAHAVDRARAHLPDPAAETFAAAHRDLCRALEPMFVGVDLELRRRVADLIASGSAPSPFCVVSPALPGEHCSPGSTEMR